jgi:pSer/pThr/pTyr-binding forkhead associated (FHA) protein
MPYLQVHDAHHQLAAGETRVGRGTDADIRLPEFNAEGDEVRETLAVITLAPDHTATLRVSDAEGSVFVNGVPIGLEPAPLLHGDRLTIEGCELRFADEAQSGDTQEIPTTSAEATATPSAGVREARSRGRIVSLVDGREYAVAAEGLTLGREAGCDVVIAAGAVSRRHARIEAADSGYVVIDLSTNGVLVNGARVADRLPLGRGDTIRIGQEEYRFYADAEPAAKRLDLASVPSLQVTSAFAAVKRPPPRSATPAAVATVAPPRRKMPLAVLEVLNEGLMKGQRFELTAPLSHVGRGEHNDVPVLDDSVSESHAKVQRRDEAWWVIDMDSTNGTYVAGERVFGETRLTNGADVRFGGVKMSFRTFGGSQRATGETRVIVGVRGPDPKRAEQRLRELARGVEPLEPPPDQRGAPTLLWIALLLLAAVTVFLVLQGR